MTRNFGDLALLDKPEVDDHACLIFEESIEFERTAVEFLYAGLGLEQRLVYVGEGDPDSLAQSIGHLGDVDRLRDTGTLVISTIEEFCDPRVGVIAEDQLDRGRALLDGALADGYAGVRFAADVTRLAAEPLSWTNHLRWEQLADAEMDGLPFSALCGYRGSEVGEEAAAALSCVHPLRNAQGAPIGLFWRDGIAALEGDLDRFQLPTLRACLSVGDDCAGDLIIDASQLRFIDGAAMAELGQIGQDLQMRGRQLKVYNAPVMVRRLQSLLGFDDCFAVVE
jgi:anti-anti-sigma regulatory factor